MSTTKTLRMELADAEDNKTFISIVNPKESLNSTDVKRSQIL